ncbi:MAG TPA: hypothetical protein VN915_12250 [Elusimicrobiota bacterium]|nr:hypothetical protein [Elusimicrobiota bacterium]
MKREIDKLKRDVGAVRKSTRNIAVNVSRLVGEMHDLNVSLRQDMSKGFERVLGRIDSFAGEVDSSRRQRSLQDKDISSIHAQLVDHEVRLARIERPERKS